MKTYRNLYKKLCSFENLHSAYKKARKRKTNKHYVIAFEKDLREHLIRLQSQLLEKTYKPELIKTVIIRDPKTRKIGKAPFRDRIVHHALVNVLEQIFEPLFIYDNYASRKNKGQHKALERFDYFKKKVSKNGKKLRGIKDANYIQGYVLKADISKYFESVDHEILLRIIEEKVKDDSVLWLVKQILQCSPSSNGKGIPLGNYTSQFFANIYLNKFDYFVKHTLRAKYYLRYVDDFVILHENKEKLERYKKYVDDYLHSLGLKLHPTKSRVMALHKGTPLLGFRVFYHYKLLKESGIRQIKRNLVLWRELFEIGEPHEKLGEKLEGWLAHASHGDTYYFRKKIVAEFNRIFSLNGRFGGSS